MGLAVAALEHRLQSVGPALAGKASGVTLQK